MKTQIAVANVAARQVRCFGQSLDGAIFVAGPCINHSKLPDQGCAFDRVLANRRQLDRAFAFANRVLLVAKHGIDNAKRAKCSGIIRLLLYGLDKLASSAVECRSSCRLITAEFGKLPLAPAAREWNVLIETSTLSHVE